MERNKLFFVKQLYFVFFIVLFAAFSLYAEDDLPGSEIQTEADSNPESESSGLLPASEEDISAPSLNDQIGKIHDSLDHLSNSISKPQIWRIITAISLALIALLLSIAFVFAFLDHFKLPLFSWNKQKPAEEKHIIEQQLPDETKTVSQKIISSEFAKIKNKLDDIQYQIDKIDNKIKSQSEKSSRFQNDLSSFQTEMGNLKQLIEKSNDEFSLLKIDIEKNSEKLARKEQVENDPIYAFNQWAQNPHLSFPEFFTYVSNVKLEFRTKQEFISTQTETDWIRNTVGEKKYLFPNPNNIDNLSGPIDKLYKVTGNRNAKGLNSVKISSACEIKEGNFIEYQGELLLL